jgi:ketosteroid isomerase-like protein
MLKGFHPMNRRIAVSALAALLLSSSLAYSQSAPATVQAAEQEWYDALVAASGPRLNALIADDFAYQHPTGNTYDKADFVAQFTSKNVTVTKLGAVDRSVRDFGPTVVVYGSNAIEGMLGGQPYAGTIRWVNVWRNQNGGWRIVHRNSEILPQQ